MKKLPTTPKHFAISIRVEDDDLKRIQKLREYVLKKKMIKLGNGQVVRLALRAMELEIDKEQAN